MIKLFVFILGLLFWFPAVGLTINQETALQPIEIASILLLPVMLPASRYFLKVRTVKALFLVLLIFVSWALSTAFSEDQSQSIRYLVYHLVFVGSFLIVLMSILSYPARAIYLVHGFIAGAMLTAILVIYQKFISFSQIAYLRNNPNFTISLTDFRPTALMPETSSVSQLTCVAFCVVLTSLVHQIKRHGVLAALNTRWFLFYALTFTLLILSIPLLSSTLAFAFLPFSLLIAFQANKLKFSRLFFAALLITPAIVYIVNLTVTLSLQERGIDAITSSAMNRLSSIIGFFYSTGDIGLTGFGLGINDHIAEYAEAAKLDFDLTFFHAPTGINSFFLARIFEEGAIMVVITGIVVYSIIKVFIGNNNNTSLVYRQLSSLGLALLVPALFVSSYRGFFHLWLVVGLGIYFFCAYTPPKYLKVRERTAGKLRQPSSDSLVENEEFYVSEAGQPRQ